jgi:hypothetical protein
MASRNKKTTMAKLMRESRLRERRMDKQARKDARRTAAENGTPSWADSALDEPGMTQGEDEAAETDDPSPAADRA